MTAGGINLGSPQDRPMVDDLVKESKYSIEEAERTGFVTKRPEVVISGGTASFRR